MLKPNWSFLKKIVAIAGVSLLFEVLQFIFAIGGSDITDLMGNTLGGIIGVGVYIVFCKLFSTKANKILNVLASIGTICIFALVLLLICGFIIYKFHVIGELLFMKINRGYTINDFDTAGSLFIKQE